LVTVRGTVDEFTFRNPHGVLLVTAEGEGGAAQQWKIETNSPNILRRRGWTESSIKAGDSVTIEGYPARDGSNFMDAAVFDGVAARYMAWTRRPGEHVYPYDCDPAYGE
jgi:hypothetical protein